MAVLTGKAVVITGSGRGIGAACAKGAARQGAAVVVNDIDAGPAEETVAAIKAEGGTAVACVADITDWDEAGRLIRYPGPCAFQQDLTGRPFPVLAGPSFSALVSDRPVY